MNTTAAPPILDRLSALGDESRTRILALLERSELTVTELASVLRIAQPTVSRHLKTLAGEGWVEARADGRNRHYRIAAGLDETARELWRIVRAEIAGEGVYAVDAERARGVLERRRLRSAEFFATAAERWDEVREQLFGAAAGLAPLLGLIRAEWTVADLGVGTGALAETLAPFATRVIGVDRSEQMLAAATHRLEGHANVELRRGELESIPVPDGEVDVAVLGLVLHYVVDPPVVLDEVRRITRPGGRLLLIDMRRHEGGSLDLEDMGHVWPGFDPERMRQWLAEAGFVEIRVVPLPADPSAAGPLLFLASATRP
ncbi:MAG TPA: metalloregulator ArsR/SmtB family transcription factor [Longimicrobiales bacterium]|nr:metalloregulator ArsR/SmtB family transcription factor [Longimicrobiales bacterium]